MLTAGIIAASGFASLATFGVTSVRAFGLLLASGIVSALVIEMTFTPAVRCLLRAPRRYETTREAATRRLDRWIGRLADSVVAAPGRVLAVALGVALACGAGTLFLRVDNSFRFWFAPSTVVRQDDAVLNEKLPGTATIRLLVEGAHDGALREPAVLAAVADLEAFLDDDPAVGGVSSIADHVRRMHQAMHEDAPAYHVVPGEARLVAQYLFLYEMAAGPDGLAAFVDTPYRNAVVRALSKTDSAAFSRDLIARLEAWTATRFAGLPARVGIAGGTIGVQTALNEVVVHEKLVNVVQVGAIIFVASALFLRSLAGGALVLMPLGLAVAVTLGLMGWTGTWLDMTTAAITAMGVSIGADFAIYLLFRMREELAAGAPLVPAVRAALRTSGKAIFFVSSAVAVGYLVLLLSGFSIWVRLGVLTALIVSVSALATLAVIPAIALLVRPRFLGTLEDYAGGAPRTSEALTPP
jgi:predicted RND superfamily exporter protein